MPREKTQFNKGNVPWNAGKKRPPFSEEWKKRIGERLRGNTHTKGKSWKVKDTSNMGHVPWNKGLKGVRHHSEETKKKMREVRKGSKAYQWKGGKPRCEKCEKELSARGCRVCLGCRDRNGEKNPMWCGGKSFEPYTLEWNRRLKEEIRERDNFTCQICKDNQGKRKFSVHHIDYNKKNCTKDNLITLCVKCHSKTNHNRENWIQYFKRLCLITKNH